MLSALVFARPSAPVTCTVKFAVPTVVGVPLICPAPFNVRPAGRLPATTLQAYGVAPPVAASWAP